MPKVFKKWRDSSRADWGSNIDPEIENLSLEHVRTGALLRIADAIEVVAKDRVQMEKDLKFYKDAYHESRDEVESLNRSISTYKSHITRLKNKIKGSI